MLAPLVVVSMVLALPLANFNSVDLRNQVTLTGEMVSGAEVSSLVPNVVTPSATTPRGDSIVTMFLLLGTGIVGLVGINRKKQ